MEDYSRPEDLPLGLMMQLGQDREAMNSFANLSEAEKENLVAYIKSAVSGDDAKARIEQVMDSLSQHQGFY